jgi:hypothetical protein
VQPAPPAQQPNIVFILLDNVGWGDLGVYGGMTPTPRIDKLANEGIRFNNYNVEAQCTPTRSAIMTGRSRSGRGRIPFLTQAAALTVGSIQNPGAASAFHADKQGAKILRQREAGDRVKYHRD